MNMTYKDLLKKKTTTQIDIYLCKKVAIFCQKHFNILMKIIQKLSNKSTCNLVNVLFISTNTATKCWVWNKYYFANDNLLTVLSLWHEQKPRDKQVKNKNMKF